MIDNNGTKSFEIFNFSSKLEEICDGNNVNCLDSIERSLYKLNEFDIMDILTILSLKIDSLSKSKNLNKFNKNLALLYFLRGTIFKSIGMNLSSKKNEQSDDVHSENLKKSFKDFNLSFSYFKNIGLPNRKDNFNSYKLDASYSNLLINLIKSQFNLMRITNNSLSVDHFLKDEFYAFHGSRISFMMQSIFGGIKWLQYQTFFESYFSNRQHKNNAEYILKLRAHWNLVRSYKNISYKLFDAHNQINKIGIDNFNHIDLYVKKIFFDYKSLFNNLDSSKKLENNQILDLMLSSAYFYRRLSHSECIKILNLSNDLPKYLDSRYIQIYNQIQKDTNKTIKVYERHNEPLLK